MVLMMALESVEGAMGGAALLSLEERANFAAFTLTDWTIRHRPLSVVGGASEEAAAEGAAESSCFRCRLWISLRSFSEPAVRRNCTGRSMCTRWNEVRGRARGRTSTQCKEKGPGRAP